MTGPRGAVAGDDDEAPLRRWWHTSLPGWLGVAEPEGPVSAPAEVLFVVGFARFVA
jgi:hypothetical protein